MILTFNGFSHGWLCDQMGHLNTRHYAAMFDDAAIHLMNVLGFSWSTLSSSDYGWANAKDVVEYKEEVPLGIPISIYSGIKRVGTKSITTHHAMHNSETNILHATLTTTLVCFDTKQRISRPLPEHIKLKAKELMIDMPEAH